MLNDLLYRNGDVVNRCTNSNIYGTFLEKIMGFTTDWVTPNEANFRKCMDALSERNKFLEIGSFEGRSTCWLLQNGLASDGTMVCVDTFKPSWYEGGDLLEIFTTNVRDAKKKGQILSTFAMDSFKALNQLAQQKTNFDFVYIDGDHSPSGVLTDAVIAWHLLRQGGIMLFDDYEYDAEPTKVGIQGFMQGFVGKYDLVLQNYQLAVKKK